MKPFKIVITKSLGASINMQLFGVTYMIAHTAFIWVYLFCVTVSVGCLLRLICSWLFFLYSSVCKYIWRSRILIFWHIACYSICCSAVNTTVAQLCQVAALCRLFYCQVLGYLYDQLCRPVGSRRKCLLLIFPDKLCHFCCRGQIASLGHVMQKCAFISWMKVCQMVES